MPATSWVAFINAEAHELLATFPNLPRRVLRGHLRDRLAEAFRHPLAMDVRGLVVGERALEVGGAGQVSVQRAATRFLEVVPEGLTREAASLSGPLLVPSERALQAGSVVRGKLVLEDPRLRELALPGLVGSMPDLDVEVAVEP